MPIDQKEVDKLVEAAYFVTYISCYKCFTKIQNTLPKQDLAEYAYNKGWRTKKMGVADIVICPACIKE